MKLKFDRGGTDMVLTDKEGREFRFSEYEKELDKKDDDGNRYI